MASLSSCNFIQSTEAVFIKFLTSDAYIAGLSGSISLVQQRHADKITSQHLSGDVVECSAGILGRPTGMLEHTAAMLPFLFLEALLSLAEMLGG